MIFLKFNMKTCALYLLITSKKYEIRDLKPFSIHRCFFNKIYLRLTFYAILHVFNIKLTQCGTSNDPHPSICDLPLHGVVI